MSSLLKLRLQKMAYALTHPGCWRALRLGVAPSLEHAAVLRGIQFDHLLDVGGNRGQFSLMTRLLKPGIAIHAFEPLPEEAAVYKKVFQGVNGVVLTESALGDTDGTATIHVSGRADSSSLLPIGELQAKLFPNTAEVGTQTISVRRLDGLPELWSGWSRALLKLDVQGFELPVLRGARQALRNCAYVYAECSEVPLYEGQALYPEVAAFLAQEGFQPARRANDQWVDGKLVQADHLFVRV
jgi:FkbM family methyltransferase